MKRAMSYVNKGINPITFSGLNIAVTSDESKSHKLYRHTEDNNFRKRYVRGGQNKTPPQAQFVET